ncbi:hypothetical protein PV08_05822 [Exophiala spinifera]|uniref:Major facilitator superfamily (MFS) profile domain-containing protein n=1 Tax=Exophiala spinifera TaxID=91928 RepID=A0A0D1ZSG7_9EURO|nr:uncharacterized protein PV08_05822 [Exophiala spinifera]KIW15772.1 hypothetical protein PV08_05822 [Exophiala spinifera]
MALSSSVTRILIVLFVALGSMTYGYCSSIISITLSQPSFISYFEMDTRSNASDLTGTINGVFQAGGFIGTLSCLGTADWLGRRKALLAAAALTVLGGALQAGSVNIGMYIVMRAITGVGIGALVTLVPLYQSEIAPPKIRGLLVGMHGTMIGTGYALAVYIGFGFYFVNASGAQWRIPLAIQCLPPLLLACGIMMLPETPRWLIMKDRVGEAFDAFRATRSESSDSLIADEVGLRADFDHLHRQTLHELQHVVPFKQFLFQKSLRKRCFIGFMTMFGAQCTATIVINNYGPSLYSSLGFSTVATFGIQSGWISTAPFGNFINAIIVDRVGRVRLLLIGFTGCLLALMGECITVSFFQSSGSRGAASGAVFFLFAHITVFVLCVDATTYIYASEIFPTPLRAKGLAISCSGLFFATIIFTTAAPTAFANIGWKYYLVFVVLTTITISIVYFMFPETRQLSLEDVQGLFGDSVDEVDFIEGANAENQRVEKSTKHPEESVTSEATITKG